MESARLLPASPDDLADVLARALLHEGRKRVRHADGMMARITAAELVEHLTRAGFVLMKAPPGTPPSVLGRD